MIFYVFVPALALTIKVITETKKCGLKDIPKSSAPPFSVVQKSRMPKVLLKNLFSYFKSNMWVLTIVWSIRQRTFMGNVSKRGISSCKGHRQNWDYLRKSQASALWHYSAPYAGLSVGSKIYWKSNLQSPLLFSLYLNKCKGNQTRKLWCSGMGLSVPFLTIVAPFWVESSLGNRWNRLILFKVSFYGALITLLPVFFQALRNWVIVANIIFFLSQIWLNLPGSRGSSMLPALRSCYTHICICNTC